MFGSEFRLSPDAPDELFQFARKQKTWQELCDDPATTHLEFQIFIVEKLQFKDYQFQPRDKEEKNKESGWGGGGGSGGYQKQWKSTPTIEGIGMYGLVDRDTRIYLHQEDFNPYITIDIPARWSESQIDEFCNDVICTSQSFQDRLLRRHTPEQLVSEWRMSKQDKQQQKPAAGGVVVPPKEEEMEDEDEDLRQALMCVDSSDNLLSWHTFEYNHGRKHRVEGRTLRIYLRKGFLGGKIADFLSRPSVRNTLIKQYGLQREDSLPIEDRTLFEVFDVYDTKERYFTNMDVCAGMWIRIPKSRLSEVPDRERTQWAGGLLEMRCSWKDIERVPDKIDKVPIRVVSYDIEQDSHDGVSFPDSTDRRDIVYNESFSYAYDDDPKDIWKFTIMVSPSLQSCMSRKHKMVRIAVDTFADFCDLKQTLFYVLDPDDLVAYNNHNYDNPKTQQYAATAGLCQVKKNFFGKRTYAPVFSDDEEVEEQEEEEKESVEAREESEMAIDFGFAKSTASSPAASFKKKKQWKRRDSKTMPKFGYFSRRANYFCPCDPVEGGSKQTGSVDTHRWMLPGRNNYDIYMDVKQSYKKRSYKLDDVAFETIGKRKVPLPPREQFRKYKAGLDVHNPNACQEHTDIAVYCEQDCVLPLELYFFYSIRDKYTESSRANLLNSECQPWRGQQIRVMQNLLLECQNMKAYDKPFLIPYQKNIREDKLKSFTADGKGSAPADGDDGDPGGDDAEEERYLLEEPGEEEHEQLFADMNLEDEVEAALEQETNTDMQAILGSVQPPGGCKVEEEEAEENTAAGGGGGDIYSILERVVHQSAFRWNLDELVWDPQHDKLLGLQPRTGPRKSPYTKSTNEVDILIAEAEERKKLLLQYQQKHSKFLDFKQTRNVPPPPPSSSSQAGHTRKQEEECMEREYSEWEQQREERSNKRARFEAAIDCLVYLSRSSSESVKKARFKAEGITVESVDSQYKPLHILLSENAIDIAKGYLPRHKHARRASKKKKALYDGATVLEPRKGFYSLPLFTLDFSSLYPSIMRAFNMSFETYITPYHIKKFGYVEGKDYVKLLESTKKAKYRYPFQCAECEENKHVVGYKCCSKEIELDDPEIKNKDLREGIHYYSVVEEIQYVYFTKKLCSECRDCKECAKLDGRESKFCTQHTTCRNCPAYRRPALLPAVLTRLLAARKTAKKLMEKYEDQAKAVFYQYLDLCGLPRTTKVKNTPQPSTPEQEALWDKYKTLMKLVVQLNQKQMAFKVTCNSVYGFCGAAFGFCPNVHIAAAVTAKGREMIYAVKHGVANTAKLWSGFMPSFSRDVVFPKDPGKLEKALENHQMYMESPDDTHVTLVARFPDIGYERTVRILLDDIRASYDKCVIVYGDTDSVMPKLHIPDCLLKYVDPIEPGESSHQINLLLAYVWCLAERASKYCTSLCEEPNSLELEKLMYPMLLINKKRYIYMKYTQGIPASAGKAVASGVCEVRRDFAPIVPKIFKEVKEIVLQTTVGGLEKQRERAIAVIQKYVQEIWDQKIPLEMMKISRQLGKIANYKTQNLPHLFVYHNRIARDKSDVAFVGDRIEYYIRLPVGDISEMRVWQMAEDPVYGEHNNIPYHSKYYIEQQLMKPIVELMTWVLYSDDIIKAEDSDFEETLKYNQKAQYEMLRQVFDSSSSSPNPRKRRMTFDEASETTRRKLFDQCRKSSHSRSYVAEQKELESQPRTVNVLRYVQVVATATVSTSESAEKTAMMDETTLLERPPSWISDLETRTDWSQFTFNPYQPLTIYKEGDSFTDCHGARVVVTRCAETPFPMDAMPPSVHTYPFQTKLPSSSSSSSSSSQDISKRWNADQCLSSPPGGIEIWKNIFPYHYTGVYLPEHKRFDVVLLTPPPGNPSSTLPQILYPTHPEAMQVEFNTNIIERTKVLPTAASKKRSAAGADVPKYKTRVLTNMALLRYTEAVRVSNRKEVYLSKEQKYKIQVMMPNILFSTPFLDQLPKQHTSTSASSVSLESWKSL